MRGERDGRPRWMRVRRVRRTDVGVSGLLENLSSRRPEGLRRGPSGRDPAGRTDPQGADRREGLNAALCTDGRRGVCLSLSLRSFPGAVLSSRTRTAAAAEIARRRAQDGVRPDEGGGPANRWAVGSGSCRHISRPSEPRGGGVCPPRARGPRTPPPLLSDPEGPRRGEGMGGHETIRARRTEILGSSVGTALMRLSSGQSTAP